MAKNKNTVSYSADELRARIARGEDQTDWQRVDQIAADDIDADGEAESQEPDWNWTQAKLVIPAAKEQISLRVDANAHRNDPVES